MFLNFGLFMQNSQCFTAKLWELIHMWSREPSSIISFCSFGSHFSILVFTGQWSNANWRWNRAGLSQHGVPKRGVFLNSSCSAFHQYILHIFPESLSHHPPPNLSSSTSCHLSLPVCFMTYKGIGLWGAFGAGAADGAAVAVPAKALSKSCLYKLTKPLGQ